MRLGDKRIAITQLKNIVDQPLEVNDTLISSGTFNFVGNALIFHKTNPEPFTVTYTIDVELRNTIIYLINRSHQLHEGFII
jgi:uncharacterized membrane protein YsdA (DUF1294 family)